MTKFSWDNVLRNDNTGEGFVLTNSEKRIEKLVQTLRQKSEISKYWEEFRKAKCEEFVNEMQIMDNTPESKRKSRDGAERKSE